MNYEKTTIGLHCTVTSSKRFHASERTKDLLADELGWQVELAYNQEVLGENGTFGRSSYKDILLVRYFHRSGLIFG